MNFMLASVLLLLAILQTAVAQNVSACDIPETSIISAERYRQISRDAVFKYLAGEDDDTQMVDYTKQGLSDEKLLFLASFLKMLDPTQVKESAYYKMLESGKVPEGRLADINIERIIEQKASMLVKNLQGPEKIFLDLLRLRPHLKYNPDELKKQLAEKMNAYGKMDSIEEEEPTENFLVDECRADLNYLYGAIGPSLSCSLQEAILNLIDNLLPGANCEDLCFDNPILPIPPQICVGIVFCLNITAPTRTTPNITGTYIDAQFKIPPGLSQGNLAWVGSYDQCQRIQDVNYDSSLIGMDPAETRTLQARYCRVQVWPSSAVANDSDPPLYLHLGVCVPNSCASPESIANITAGYEVIGLRVYKMFCGFDELKLEDEPSAQTALGIIIIMVILLAAATLYDMLIRKQLMARILKKVAPYLDSGSPRGSIVPSSPRGSIAPSSPVEDKPVSFSLGPEDNAMNGVNNLDYPVIAKPIFDKQISYTEVHNDDKRRYSLQSNSDSFSGLQRPPSYVSQVSSMSTSNLLNNELGAMKQKINVHDPLDDPPSWLERLEGAFVAFSGYSNVVRTWCLDNTSERLISCDGVKVISCVWSIYGFTWLLGTLYSEAWTTTNLLPVALEVVRTFLFQIVINFPFSADSAFVVAGCLFTYNWLTNYEKEKKITWKTVVHFILHRYFRLMIPMMLMLMFYTCLYKFVVAGPLIPPNISDADKCRETWYLNLLMAHNWFTDGGMCITWTFNVAILFQFHVVAPFILVPLALKPIVGFIIYGLTWLAHLTALGIYAADLADTSNFGVWFNDILLTPWCRAGPILVGMATGYAIFTHKRRKFTIPIFARLLIWILSIGFLMAPIFSTYDALKEDGNLWNRAETINYQLWSRTAFGGGVGWLIFSAEAGIGGYPGRILSYKQWVPLSRLSYMSTLFGAIFIFRNVYSQMQPITITSHVMLYFFLGNMTMTLLVSTAFSLLFQSPFAEVENAILAKTKRQIIQMGRNPLKEMGNSHKNVSPEPTIHLSASTQEMSGPPDGLSRTISGRPAVDLKRTISHTSQL